MNMIDTSSQGSTSADVWDQPSDYTSLSSYPPSAATKSRKAQQVVPDDWDNDEDEEEDSAKVWEDANNKAPMPELIISPSSTGTCVVPPPPAAFQPTMRILKRPSPSQSASNSATSLSSQTRNTLAEREAQYQEARNRIFGTTIERGGDDQESQRGMRDGSGKGSDARSAASAVLRTPTGPSDVETEVGRTDDSPPKGFRDRRNGKNQNSASSSVLPRTSS
ncbi:hypothetical protein DEU56DRAFT_810137 [Suillus clintonianus]|uniref:uncharacterized protein n=1 Tax=Suillus clintonianus TaxID=1904413 RepID=UPI001B87D473|nr:uncharacterized protein DEU56DRAFT_810137 [Suillus clintonianus]KAG2134131.1 hypothetical protein DEU56DRAFT_810137 [Suillus clintonianus]